MIGNHFIAHSLYSSKLTKMDLNCLLKKYASIKTVSRFIIFRFVTLVRSRANHLNCVQSFKAFLRTPMCLLLIKTEKDAT